MKILYISRAHPPIIGGIENQNEAVGRWLSKVADCQTIINRHGKRFLPFFLPYAILKGLFVTRNADVILLGDGVLALVGWALKRIYPNKPLVCIVHGLDITYCNSMYQKFWLGYFFTAVDEFIAVSTSTSSILIERGFDSASIVVIPNGIDFPDDYTTLGKEKLSILLGMDVSDKKVLLTLGRLVKRKGVSWFLKEVLPELPDDILYVIAGTGPEKNIIKEILEIPSNKNKAKYIGSVTDQEKALLLSSCDLFIQPNILVPGDTEGFGVVILEAGIYGLPVIASRMQGLEDSVVEGKNGWLVSSQDREGFKQHINKILQDKSGLDRTKEIAREHIKANFHWSNIIQSYLLALRSVK